MLERTSERILHGDIVAYNVTADAYMEDYAEHFYEWVDGVVIKISPANIKHQLLSQFLSDLVRYYLQKSIGGMVISPPFVMRLDAIKSRREPDLIVVLEENISRFKETYLEGPADICIEIISPGSDIVDRGDKFIEYEQGGVKEYWLFDQRRIEAKFYRRNEEDIFISISPVDGKYTTPLLPRFVLDIATLWQTPLPDMDAALEQVKAMLA